MLECIRRVLPTGNEQWELVAELHAIQYGNCCRNGGSIKKKFYKLANMQPCMGDPNIPHSVLMSKEIRESSNQKAGVNDLEVTDFFEEAEVEQEINDGEEVEAIPTTVTASSRRGSTVSSATSTNNFSIVASASVVNSKAKTKTNQLTSAIETASNAK